MSKQVAFETKADDAEVGITITGDRAVRIKAGKTHKTSDPDEIAALDAHEDVKRAKKQPAPKSAAKQPKAPKSAAKQPKAPKRAATSPSTSGAPSSASQEG